MKIAYISVQDSTNVRSFSGTGYFIPRSLKMNGAEIKYIGNLKTQPYLTEKFKEIYYRYIPGKTYWFNRNPRVLKNYARQINKSLKGINPDVVLSFSGQPLALLETDKPIVLWADAVFEDIIDFYPEFTDMAKVTIKQGHIMEKAALDRCTHIVYSSDWAAKGAIQYYNIPPEKVSVITYGANIETNWDQQTVDETIMAKTNEQCNLLFAGVHWYRKGGDKALEVAKELHSQGMPVKLDILGCRPDNENQLPSYVKVHGFISKETEKGKATIHKLISNAHFLVLPTLADCTPIVFAEFNSYGIPCLTTKVGGIPTLIKNEVNGKLFDKEAPASEYAEYIKSLFTNYNDYQTLAQRSYNEYKTRLNWNTSGKKMMGVLKNIVNGKS
jgi:glycosyltransferase involved in cell wall biosynthesis